MLEKTRGRLSPKDSRRNSPADPPTSDLQSCGIINLCYVKPLVGRHLLFSFGCCLVAKSCPTL